MGFDQLGHRLISRPEESLSTAIANYNNTAAAATLVYGDDPTLLISSGYVGELSENQFISPVPHEDVFGYDSPTMSSQDPNSNYFIRNCLSGDVISDIEEENNDGVEHSSTPTTTTATTTPSFCCKKAKVDRSRTLISERRRRSRMKEKLYALRTLVPNITKMDKASIVGDAVLYVQELQSQSQQLKAEIADIESSASASASFKRRGSAHIPKTRSPPLGPGPSPISHSLLPHVRRTIIQMDVIQVEERGYHIRLVSNKGQGVAVSLYRAIESLPTFLVHSSNLTTVDGRYILTFTMRVGECREGINAQDLKLRMTGALLKQGFEFQYA